MRKPETMRRRKWIKSNKDLLLKNTNTVTNTNTNTHIHSNTNPFDEQALQRRLCITWMDYEAWIIAGWGLCRHPYIEIFLEKNFSWDNLHWFTDVGNRICVKMPLHVCLQSNRMKAPKGLDVPISKTHLTFIFGIKSPTVKVFLPVFIKKKSNFDQDFISRL